MLRDLENFDPHSLENYEIYEDGVYMSQIISHMCAFDLMWPLRWSKVEVKSYKLCIGRKYCIR